MFLDVLLGSKATWRILLLMAESPGSRLTRAEIKKFTCLGNNAITESMKDLLIHNIMNARKNGKTSYGLDMADEMTKQILLLCEMERKRLNGIPYSFSLILREYVRIILAISAPLRIILFGSVAKRVYREDSDIDIAIIFDDELKTQARLDMEGAADRLKKRFGKEIQQHIFTVKEFEISKDKLVLEIRRDGIDLL